MEKNKPNVLFVNEKWCDCNPAIGLSNSYEVLFGSLKRSGIDVPFDIIHYDELMLQHNVHIDKVLENVCAKYNSNIIMLSMQLGPNKTMNPSVETIKKLKEKGCYICFIWPDIQAAFGMNELNELNNLANLHISHAAENNIPGNNKILWLWTPLDSKIYYPPTVSQDIPVSFIGSVRYADRQQYLSHALQCGLPVTIDGGQREKKLTPEQYAYMIKRSKININFSSSPGGTHQLKGRVFETIACGSMLLESKNDITHNFFVPGKEFVQFDGPQDFVEKIAYYLNNEQERLDISKAGLKKFQENWTSFHFWNKVFDRIKKEI